MISFEVYSSTTGNTCVPLDPWKRYQLDFQAWQAGRNNKHLDKYLHSTGQHNACIDVSLTAFFFQCTPLSFIRNIYQVTADFYSHRHWYNIFCLPSPLLTSLRNHFNDASFFFQMLSPKYCLWNRHFHLTLCLKTISSNNYVSSVFLHFHWSEKLISSCISCIHRKKYSCKRQVWRAPIVNWKLWNSLPWLPYSVFLKSAIASKNARLNPVF